MKEQILQVIVPVLGTVLTAAIVWAGAKLASFIQAKTKNEFLKGALARAEEAVQTAVLEVKQIYVDAIKEGSADGTLTVTEASLAKRRAIEAAKNYLGKKGLLELLRVFGFDDAAVDSFLGGKVEATIASAKIEALPEPTAKTS